MRVQGGPFYTQRDLKEWVTLGDVFDAHEAMDLEAAMAHKLNKGNA